MPSLTRRVIAACMLASMSLLTSCAATPAKASGGDSPRHLLQLLRDASASDDYEQVARLVYRYRPYMGMDAPGANIEAPDIVVLSIKYPREDYNGDWSYSDAALDVILRHADEFGPVPENRLSMERDVRRTRMPDEPEPEAFCYWDSKGCRIWLVRSRGKWKLCFWEGMTRLL